MNIGTLTVSMALRTVGAAQSLNTFEKGVLGSVSRMNAKMASLGRTFTYAVAAPILIGGAQAIKMFSEFEYAMAKITGLAGVQAKQVQAWAGSVLELSRLTGKSAQELAEGLYFVASSGMKGAKAMEVLKMSALGAMAGLGKTMDIANLLTSVINAYGAENIKSAHAMDVLVAAVREGKAEADDMAKALGYVVNVAAEMGISFENVAAAVAATTRTGASASTSVTQLRQLLFSFIKERPQVEKAFKMMGLEYQEVRGWLSEDLLSGLIKLKAVTDAWGVETLGKVFPNVRALNEFLALTGENLQENFLLFKEIQNPTNAFRTAVDAVANTAKVRLDKALQTINTSLISFGGVLAEQAIPLIQKLATLISELFGWFNSLNPEMQKFILMAGTLGAVLGPALIALSSFVSTILGLSSMLLNPIGLFIALAAGIILVVRNLDLFQKAWPNVLLSLKIKWNETLLDLFTSWDNFSSWMEDTFGWVSYIADALMLLVNPMATVTALGSAGKTSTEYVAELEAKIKSLQATKANFEYGVGDAVLESLKRETKGIFEWIQGEMKKFSLNFGGATTNLNIGGNDLFIEDWFDIIEAEIEARDATEKLNKAFGRTGDLMKGMMQGGVAGLAGYFGVLSESLLSIADPKVLQVMQEIAKLSKEAYAKSMKVATANIIYDNIMAQIKGMRKIQADLDLKSSMNERNNDLFGIGSLGKVQQKMESMQSYIDAWKGSIVIPEEAIAKIREYQDELVKLTMQQEMYNMAAQGAASVLQSIGTMIGDFINGTEDAFKNFVISVLSMLQQLAAQLLTVAITAALMHGIVKGGLIAGLAVALVGISAILAVIQGSKQKASSATKLANGGIIPPGFPNDTFPANLTSKEAVIPLDRLPGMLGLRKNTNQKVVFVIDGHVIQGILQDANNLSNIY